MLARSTEPTPKKANSGRSAAGDGVRRARAGVRQQNRIRNRMPGRMPRTKPITVTTISVVV